mmetsp:Transcript_38927/g.64648  ORF Transcript_38927/g.64648 Transcript_38927/m.64648 type:complete len:449 (-) Transcript_38927:140-1486(-)
MAPDTLRQRIFLTFEDPGYSQAAKAVSLFLMVVILISTACFILESEASSPNGFIPAEPAGQFFYVVEWISVVIFTIEYCIRVSTCPRLSKFLVNFQNTIDVAAWLPFWIVFFTDPGAAVPYESGSGDSGPPSTGFVRAVRLVRVFRVFKFGRYSLGIQMFTGALRSSTQPLLILVILVSIAMVILSSMIYIAEMNVSNVMLEEYERSERFQDICFGTIPNAFWWALATMTTVGYGDCYPLSTTGKVISSLTMVCGVLILALPITVVGSNFAKMVEMYEEESLRFTDTDGSGMVDELELREWLVMKKKEGKLRKDMPPESLLASTLMEKYDPQGIGKLILSQFQQLQHDVLVADDDVENIEETVHDVRKMLVNHHREFEMHSSSIEKRLVAIESSLAALARNMSGTGHACGSMLSGGTVESYEMQPIGAVLPEMQSIDGLHVHRLHQPT